MPEPAAQQNPEREYKTFSIIASVLDNRRTLVMVDITVPSKKLLLEYFRENGAAIFGQRGTVFGFSIAAVNDQPVNDREHSMYFASAVLPIRNYVAALIQRNEKLSGPRGKVLKAQYEQELGCFLERTIEDKSTHVVLSRRHAGFALVNRQTNVTVYDEDTGKVLFDQTGPLSRRRLLKPLVPKATMQ